MGIQPIGNKKKSEMQEIRAQLEALRTRFDELQRDEDEDDEQDEEDDCLPDFEPASKSKRPQRAAAQRARKRGRKDEESDDEEEIPEYVHTPVFLLCFSRLLDAGKMQHANG